MPIEGEKKKQATFAGVECAECEGKRCGGHVHTRLVSAEDVPNNQKKKQDPFMCLK